MITVMLSLFSLIYCRLPPCIFVLQTICSSRADSPDLLYTEGTSSSTRLPVFSSPHPLLITGVSIRTKYTWHRQVLGTDILPFLPSSGSPHPSSLGSSYGIRTAAPSLLSSFHRSWPSHSLCLIFSPFLLFLEMLEAFLLPTSLSLILLSSPALVFLSY